MNHYSPEQAHHNTYEGARARQSAESLADKVHWEESLSFRGQPYRYLHHQKGVIGRFTVRLLEARELRRSYWSALALGPVKHFGLSKAHGEVTSFCTVALDFVEWDHDNPDRQQASQSASQTKRSIDSNPLVLPGSEDRKQPASINQRRRNSTWVNDDEDAQRSPVVSRNNNPVWDNVTMTFPLRKNAMSTDGMRILVKLRVNEDSTAVENLLPIGGGGEDSRLLGQGELDVTNLCLGQNHEGQALPGIIDAWIPLSLPKGEKVDEDDSKPPPSHTKEASSHAAMHSNSKQDSEVTDFSAAAAKKHDQSMSECTGRVRVFVSYEPYGMEPQTNDVVALECFARRHWPSTSCRPTLYPPLQPMRVLDRRGPYLLLATATTRATTSRNLHNLPHRIRLHRNAVFVVERQNLVDTVQNLVWLPADVFLSTPMGQAAEEMAGPVVVAGQQVLMPALLSFKLFWMAFRTTALAGFSSVQALGSTFLEEGTNSLMEQGDHTRGGAAAGGRRRNTNNNNVENNTRSSSIKLVQL